MKRLATTAFMTAILAVGTALPVYGAEHGWYVGGGLGPSRSDSSDDNPQNTLNQQLPGTSITAITKKDNSTMYKLFLGYSFTSVSRCCQLSSLRTSAAGDCVVLSLLCWA